MPDDDRRDETPDVEAHRQRVFRDEAAPEGDAGEGRRPTPRGDDEDGPDVEGHRRYAGN